jgi:8-oxo-dGTP pyrophosphatase MutT (NUDIX family)
MYKIYVNERLLMLCSAEEAAALQPAAGLLVTPYSGKTKTLFQYIDTLEKLSPRVTSIALFSDAPEQLWKDFTALYRCIEAAGGLVENEEGELLMIFRRGWWDLPKGKIDAGESAEAAAVREVAEETGIGGLKLHSLFDTTYHTYRDDKNRRCLKITYWFRLSTHRQPLLPQAEEDIEQAVWVGREELLAAPRRLYASLQDLLASYGLRPGG